MYLWREENEGGKERRKERGERKRNFPDLISENVEQRALRSRISKVTTNITRVTCIEVY